MNFKNHLISRTDDLATTCVQGFNGKDEETLSRLANHHAGKLNQTVQFEHDGFVFEVKRVKDDFFEEGEMIDISLISENGIE